MMRAIIVIAIIQVVAAFIPGKIITRNVAPYHSRLAASEPNKQPENAVSLLGEEIAELKEGLTSFQENAFESLYDKKMQWGKGNGKTDVVESETSTKVEPVAAPKAAEVTVQKVEDVVDEKPVAKKNVVAVPPIAPVVKEVTVKAVEVVAPVVKKVEVAEKNVEVKKAPEVKKGGGLFGFLQSDSAVQQIANKNQPTAPPAIAKAFMAPAPTPVKKEVKKSPEGLNMAMFKQDAAEIEAKKVMMASRPSLADAKAEAAKIDAPKIPSGAPIKAPIVPAEPAKNVFSFLTPPPAPKAAIVEKKESVAPPAVRAPAPVPVKKAPAPGGFFSFLTSDPSLVKPADPNARAPTAPPAVARAFMGPSPADIKKEGEVMSIAAMKRKAEFEQDVLDEEVKAKMMAARPSIAAAKSEASKTPSKQQLRDLAAKEAGKTVAKKAPVPGLFDMFGSDSGSSGGDLFEPRDPNALTTKEVAMIKKTVSVSAPPPKMATPAPKTAAPAPSSGGMFDFLNKGPSAPVVKAASAPVPAAAVVKKAVVVSAPVSAPAPKDAAPAGGMFGFLNKPAAPVKAAPVAVKAPVPVPAPVPTPKAAAPAGGMFGFMNPPKPAPKAAAVEVKAVAVVAPTKAAPVPSAPSGGFFGFLNPTTSPKAAPAEPKVAAVVTAKAAPVKAAPVAVKAPVPAPVPVPKAAAPAGGMFGFMNKPAAPVKAAPVAVKAPVPVPAPVPAPKAAAPAGGMFGFMNPPKPAPKAAVVEVKVEAVVAPKKAAPSGGMFGFLNSAPKETPVKAVAPAPAKAAPVKAVPAKVAPAKVTPAAPSKKTEVAVGMNVKFLASISRLLKGDSSKIKSFQTATDSFRSGAISGDAFLKILESLFGEANLESVVVPLVSELPERDAATKLRASFDKKSSVATKSSPAEKKAPFSFSFGAPKKVEAPAPVVVVPPPVKKEGFSFPSFGGSKPAATPAPKASTAVKLPAGIPAGKKSAVESQITQLLAGGDAKVFYKNITKDLGKPKTIEVMGEIIKSLPKPIGLKVDAVFKADK